MNTRIQRTKISEDKNNSRRSKISHLCTKHRTTLGTVPISANSQNHNSNQLYMPDSPSMNWDYFGHYARTWCHLWLRKTILASSLLVIFTWQGGCTVVHGYCNTIPAKLWGFRHRKKGRKRFEYYFKACFIVPPQYQKTHSSHHVSYSSRNCSTRVTLQRGIRFAYNVPKS